ncbi:MAG TPA: gamma-glutamyltransferase [Xanthobacteraceae bacterium]|nr:gamma-glutamyltransferase [Xanthobacteraceae bacterium]
MRNFQFAGRSTVHALNGMVATSHPHASLVALDILRAGGTAADAAVAVSALLGVIEPQMTGIGGDCFALYMPGGTGDIVSYNGSGRAPQAATADYFLERGIKRLPLTSAHAVTVPGVVDGWEMLLRDHGRLGLEDVMQPAIRAAEEGYVVAPRVAYDWATYAGKLHDGINAQRYFLPGGNVPKVGEVIRQPELAKTLRLIARHGRDGFYKGEVAEDIVATLRSAGGLHELADFAAHATEVTRPISTTYRGYEVHQCPPNGPGLAMLLMLDILKSFDLRQYGALSAERFHIEAEAWRIANVLRDAHVCDPSFSPVNVEGLLAPAHTSAYRHKINFERMLDLPPMLEPIGSNTIYVTVVDKDRNVCSFISSIAQPFGSAIVSEKTGVLLQNRGMGFCIEPGHPNCIAPGKRPLHTIIPAIVTQNGRAAMSYGVMGGQYQPTGQCRVLSNIVDYGMDVQEAIDFPRGLHTSGTFQLEVGVPEDVFQRLAAIGHKVVRSQHPLGGGQAIWIDSAKGTLTGGSDPRKDGCALGY